MSFSSSTPQSSPRGSGGALKLDRGGIQLLRHVQQNNAKQWQRDAEQAISNPVSTARRRHPSDPTSPPRFPTHFVYDGQFPSNQFYRGSANVAEEEPLRDARFIDSVTDTTTGSTADTDGTQTTIRIVGFREPLDLITQYRPTPNALDMGDSVMTTSFQIDQVVTDDVLLRHPRTTMLLTFVQGSIAIQMIIVAIICTIYGGSPLYTSLWCSILFLITSLTGLLFLRVYPKWRLLQLYIVLVTFSMIACTFLFILTAVLLAASERSDMRVFLRELFRTDTIFRSKTDSNRLIVGTQIAMYSLHLLLTPIYGVCNAILLYLLITTYRGTRDGEAQRAFFLSSPPGGHQQVLVPIELKQVRDMPRRVDHKQNMVTVAIQTIN